MITRSLSGLALMLPTATPVLAHEGDLAGAGFVTGFVHPILGWDHVAAMLAVGLWGALLGAPAVWVLPIAFPLVMAPVALSHSLCCRCRRSRSRSQDRPS